MDILKVSVLIQVMITSSSQNAYREFCFYHLLFFLKYLFSLFSYKTLSQATSTGHQYFRSSIINSNISKQIHDQQETSLCWAFALSTMLRSSLIIYFRSKTNLAISKNLAISFAMSNEFHKRLRREITMMPIPKPSVIKYKMINHSTPEKFQDNVIAKQHHNLKLAILRVSCLP